MNTKGATLIRNMQEMSKPGHLYVIHFSPNDHF